MIARALDDVAAEAEAWSEQLRAAGIDATTAAAESFVGGGSLPGESLPTRVVVIAAGALGTEVLAARLRAATPPIIGRLHDGRLLLDPRTVLAGEGAMVVRAVVGAMRSE